MNKLLILICILLSSRGVTSQDLIWGTLPYAGNGAGLVYNFEGDGANFKVVKNFDLSTKHPIGGLNDFQNGYLYGVTRFNDGILGGDIFRMKEDGSDFEVLLRFTDKAPNSNMINVNGSYIGTLVSNNAGSIFKMDHGGTSYTILHELSPGLRPMDGLLLASDNKIYFSSFGGSFGNGAILKYDPISDQLEILYSFETWGGANPNGFLVEGNDGFIYGTTSSGYGDPVGGSVFRISKSGDNFRRLKSFAEVNLGRDLYTGLVEADNGILFGTFSYGGQYGKGGVFQINPDGSNYQIIHHFNSIDGQFPKDDLFIYGDYLLGKTTGGGTNGKGTIFKIKTDGSDFEKIHDLTGYSYLAFMNQTCYVISYDGGRSNFGIITSFKIGESVQVLKEFFPEFGGQPTGKLLSHSNGFVYGVTNLGGEYGRGTLYKINVSSNLFEVVHNFSNEFNCCNGDIVENIDGAIIGILRSSGSDNRSHVFNYGINTGEFSIKYSTSPGETLNNIWEVSTKDYFATSRTAISNASGLLKLDSSFNLLSKIPLPEGFDFKLITSYHDPNLILGASSQGNGKIYSVNIRNHSISSLFHFDSFGQNGIFPTGELLQLEDRRVIGATRSGGAFNGGTLYSFDIAANEFKKLYDFEPTNNRPIDGVVNISDSLFYGVIRKEINSLNEDSKGAIYKYNQEKKRFSIVKNFAEIDGNFPSYGLTLARENTPLLKLYGDLNFGVVKVGESYTKNFWIKNFGSDVLTINDIIVPQDFSVSQNFTSLQPGQVYEGVLKFEPSSNYEFDTFITVKSNAVNQDDRLPLYGKSVIIVSVVNGKDGLFELYPNPTENNLILKANGSKRYSIFDSMGKEIFTGQSSGEYEYLNLEYLSSGMYMIVLYHEQKLIRRTFIKK
jgi:uncharacterized repeat protein (TIGR03803 family)